MLVALVLDPVECLKQYVGAQAGMVLGTYTFYFIYPYLPWVLCDMCFIMVCTGAILVSFSHSCPFILIALKKYKAWEEMKNKVAKQPPSSEWEKVKSIAAGKFPEAVDEKTLKGMFDLYDEDKSGALNGTEFKKFATHRFEDVLSEKERQLFVTSTFDICDSNKDGQLDLKEFALMMKFLQTEQKKKKSQPPAPVMPKPTPAAPAPAAPAKKAN